MSEDKKLVNIKINNFTHIELLIIDDGSDNDPYNQLLHYVKYVGYKVTYLRHENCGQSKSINKGVQLSSGKYISIIDADDEYKPNHLSSCLNEMNNADLIASTTNTVVNSNEDYYVPDKYDFNKIIHVDDCILFATLFGKKEVFTSLNFLDMYGADAHFYECAEKMFFVEKLDLRTYVYYRNNPDSISAKVKLNNLS